MKITVAGLGYVGTPLAAVLSQYHQVTAIDILQDKVDKINKRISPIRDQELTEFLDTKGLNLTATIDTREAYTGAHIIFIACPTDYNISTNIFDTSSIEEVLSEITKYNKNAVICIKSTIPIGYTNTIKKQYPKLSITFSPEFLREGKGLYDTINPSRIIVGDITQEAQLIGSVLLQCSMNETTPVLHTSPAEAEAIKLFSNTYLAMRVSYFNEVDSYALGHDLDPDTLIQGICMDPRIGPYYNNPSFGYGGYCLPKDTRQLLNNYSDIPNNIIYATVEANTTRREYLIDHILKQNPKVVGIYRLIMKYGSDNFRDSAIHGFINSLQARNIKCIIYEPCLNDTSYLGIEKIDTIEEFRCKSDIILANRYHHELNIVRKKVFTRDLYHRD